MNKIEELYRKNVKKPLTNIFGKIQLKSMNKRHNELALWGFEHIAKKNYQNILDIGCGGGQNLKNELEYFPNAFVCGIDYSIASVKQSEKVNKKAIKSLKCKVLQATAEKLPFDDKSFDVITAFETIYFWNLDKSFKEVYRVLNENGLFMITNETQTDENLEELMNKIDFKVYSAQQINDALTKANFKNIKIDTKNKWINVIAYK